MNFFSRPPLDSAPDAQPPLRPFLLLLPCLLAVLGMLTAWAAATTGQDARRAREQLQITFDRYYWQWELSEARLSGKPPEEIARIEKIVAAKQAARVISYARFGRQFTPWDGYRYEEIVDQGYIYHQPHSSAAEKENSLFDAGGPEKRSKNVVWYPLYPLLASGVMHYLPLSSTHALTFVSWTSCLLGAVVMFLVARRHFFHRAAALHLATPADGKGMPAHDMAALWATLLLLAGPCSIFLYANFTESLFVLLLSLLLYCIQARWWWRAAIVAAFASASRSQGVLFGPVLALAFLLRGNGGFVKRLAGSTAIGFISAIGLICYMLFLRGEFEDPIAFMHAQKYWNVGIGLDRILFALNPDHAVTHLAQFLFPQGATDWPRLWESLCLFWPPLVLILGRKLLSFEMLLFGWIFWALPYVSNSMAGNPPFDTQWMSMGRFMAVVIPIYLIFGAVLAKRPWLAPFLLFPWIAAFAVFAYKYGNGEWVG
jgi:hypothetical protein